MIDFSNNNIDKSIPYISISQVLEQIQEPFDQIGMSEKTSAKYFNNPDSEYYQMTPEQIRLKWITKGDISKRYGRLLDNYIGISIKSNFEDSKALQQYKLDNDYDNDQRLIDVLESFDNFRTSTHIFDKCEFVAREKTLYYRIENPLLDREDLFPLSEYIYIKGRFDALLRHKKTGKYLVIDWKSSGSIDKSPKPWTKRMYGPAKNFFALNWYSYTLQLHFYKKALLEGGYLPAGTKESDIAVRIVQLPGKTYNIESEAFEYDSELMDRIFKFAYKKQNLNIA